MLDAAREAAHGVTVAIFAEEAASAQADSDGMPGSKLARRSRRTSPA